MLSLTVDEHRILVFKEPVQDKALHGHVIRTVQVLNEGSCRVQCYLEPNCVSINVRPLKDGKHQCELNNATDENQSVDALKPMTGYTYFAIEVEILKVTCLLTVFKGSNPILFLCDIFHYF